MYLSIYLSICLSTCLSVCLWLAVLTGGSAGAGTAEGHAGVAQEAKGRSAHWDLRAVGKDSFHDGYMWDSRDFPTHSQNKTKMRE
jgi:hypothetical protein